MDLLDVLVTAAVVVASVTAGVVDTVDAVVAVVAESLDIVVEVANPLTLALR